MPQLHDGICCVLSYKRRRAPRVDRVYRARGADAASVRFGPFVRGPTRSVVMLLSLKIRARFNRVAALPRETKFAVCCYQCACIEQKVLIKDRVGQFPV